MSIFKVSTSRQAKNIISLPEICAELQSFNATSFLYKINLNVNTLAAVQAGGMIVRIYVLRSFDLEARKFTYFRGRTPEEIVSNLRILNGSIKDDSLSTTRNRSRVLEEVGEGSRPPEIDISSFISNDDTKLLKKNILPRKIIKKINVKSIEELNKINRNLPVLSLNVNNPAIPNGNGITTILPNKTRSQMMELLYEGKIDPASLWQPTDTYVSTRKTTGGIIPRKSYTTRRDLQDDPRKLNIVSSQVSTFNNANMQNGIGKNQYIEVIEYETINEIPVEKYINIPRTTIGKVNFTLRFEVRNTAGKIFQVAETLIQHGSNINKFMPIFPPQVTNIGTVKPGNITFNIEQKDIYAVGVSIYRRTINPNNPPTNSAYDFITNVPTPVYGNKRTAMYTDRSANSNNTYIYRFIPYTIDDVKAAVFSTVAVKLANNRTFLLPEEPINKMPNYGVLSYQILNNGINVIFENYPKDIIQIKLYKKNLTIHKPNYVLISTKKNNNSNEKYIYLDNNVKLDSIYEYKVEMVYRNGITVSVPNTMLVKYEPIISNAAICTVDNIRNSRNDLNVEFDINYAINDNNLETIRKLMKEQSLLAEYQDEISLNRENIQTFLSYDITRINLSTGDIEAFGIIPTRSFSDKIHGPPKNVKRINANNKYRYIITVYSRVPETLFPTLEVPFKWLNPLSLKTGTILSQDKHPEDFLKQGQIVDVKYLDMSFENDTYPTVGTVAATKIAVRKILIEWNVVGTLEKIDHFLIKNTVLGITNVIAVAHNISNTGVYQYNYILSQEEAGAISFSIVPIYYDYTIGTESTSNTLVI